MELLCHPKHKILEFNLHMTAVKMPYIIYAHIESLMKKKENCKINPEKPSTEKTRKHIHCIRLI